MKFNPQFVQAFILGCLASGNPKSLADLVKDFEEVFSEFIKNGSDKLPFTHLGRSQLIFSNLVHLISISFIEMDSIEAVVKGDTKESPDMIEVAHSIDLFRLQFD